MHEILDSEHCRINLVSECGKRNTTVAPCPLALGLPIWSKLSIHGYIIHDPSCDGK